MSKKKVFVIMPFSDEFFEVYEMLKMSFSECFEFSNAADESNQNNILKDIIQPIYDADIIIADLTGLNANVMYELGLAHSFNKKTIVITQDDLSKLPFDLKQYRAKDYNTHFKKFAELVDYLKINLSGAVDGTVSYSNPVKDFLILEKVDDTDWFSEKQSVILENDSDKGFLDFLADIETNTNRLTDEITQVSNDMQEMNSITESSTAEINRVNKSGGSGTTTFIRKEAKKVAKGIDTFSSKFRRRTKTISSLWDEIENNTLGLLENEIATNDNNKQNLIEYLVALYEMKDSISNSNNSMEELKTSMNNILGMERSLNQAVRFIVEDLSEYVILTNRMIVSIEKIILKSKYVVGEIDFENYEN